jgi:hypothetical protein
MSGGSFGAKLAEAISARGVECALRSLDAPFEAGPVTIDIGEIGDIGATRATGGDSLVWEGVSLTEVGAIFLERPIFSWPQPARLGSFSIPRDARERVAEREARALTISALMAAATLRPVVNGPEAGYLAASRAIALTRLEKAGFPVHPWSLRTAPEPGAEEGRIVLDLVGAERWHRAMRPPAGDQCLELEPVAGEVFGLLMVGNDLAGARRHVSAAAWAEGRGGETVPKQLVPAEALDLGARAAAALGLQVAEVWISGAAGRLELLLVEPGADLAEWDANLKGAVLEQLATRMIEIAREPY